MADPYETLSAAIVDCFVDVPPERLLEETLAVAAVLHSLLVVLIRTVRQSGRLDAEAMTQWLSSLRLPE